MKIRNFKEIAQSNFKGQFYFWKLGGTLGNVESGGTLGNLLGGTVGAHLGEPLGAQDRAAPLETE